MKVALSLALCLLFPGFVLAEEPRVSVRVMFAEVPAEMKIPADPTQLGQQKGVDMATMPVVSTRWGEPAKVELTSDFGEGPQAETPKVGVRLSVIPKLEGGKIRFVADFDYTQFAGFADGEKGEKAPMFDVRQALGMKGITDYGKAAVLTVSSRVDRQLVEQPGKPDALQVSGKKVLVILIFEKAK